MHDMRLFIIAKQIRSHDAIHFRIKVREEIGMTKKNPVKEAYIINFHDIQYNQKSCKEIPKAETISNAIQNTQNSRTCKQKYCDPCNDPANYMRTRESFLMVRHCIQNFLWCRREEFLVLNKSNATIQRKYATITITAAIIVTDILNITSYQLVILPDPRIHFSTSYCCTKSRIALFFYQRISED